MKVIDYKETLKCLNEVENCEDKTYAKSLLEWAINKRTFEAVPLSVIEDIKAEITNKADDADKGCKISSDYYIREKLRTIAQTCDENCKIIDRKVNEVKHDNTRGISRFKQFA